MLVGEDIKGKGGVCSQRSTGGPLCCWGPSHTYTPFGESAFMFHVTYIVLIYIPPPPPGTTHTHTLLEHIYIRDIYGYD